MSYYVSSGQVSTGISLNDDSMYVCSGGTASDTTVYSFGWMYVSSGGTANSVNAYGRLNVSSGGTANETTVNSRGCLVVRSGGTALNVIWTPCVGDVYIEDGATATFVSSYSGAYFGSGDVLLSSALTMHFPYRTVPRSPWTAITTPS